MNYIQTPDFYQSKAKTWRDANRDRHNAAMSAGQLRRKFGITQQQYDAILADQDGLCAICHLACVTGRKLAVDHCHSTGKIRGLLCHNCNIGIGKLKEELSILDRAKTYIASGGVSSATLSGINRNIEKRDTTDS